MKRTFLMLLVLSATFSFTSCEDEIEINKKYALEEDLSTVEWKGYSPVQYHDGSFAVKGEDIEVVEGQLSSGTFVIPILSIQNFDLPAEVKPVLLEHLKSADFFNMAVYPNATFKITKVEPESNSATNHNSNITGDFTMLGKTHSISFPAIIKFESDKLKIDANFKLDRTKWGMNYAADPALGEHHILPEVDIELNLLAQEN